MLNIIKASSEQRPKIVTIYGVEGIGKTTLAAELPKVLFFDVEHGLDVVHYKTKNKITPDSIKIDKFSDAVNAVEALIKDSKGYCNIVIDTADSLDILCQHEVVMEGDAKKKSIEDFGYGKGYTKVAEKWSDFFDKLDCLRNIGFGILLIAHSVIRKKDDPILGESYDTYELNCSKKVNAVIKQRSDALLFANYDVHLKTNDSDKKVAIGGHKRILNTTHSPAFEAKNRSNLPDVIKLEYKAVKDLFASSKKTPVMAKEKAKEKSDLNGELESVLKENGLTEDHLREYLAVKGRIDDINDDISEYVSVAIKNIGTLVNYFKEQEK